MQPIPVPPDLAVEIASPSQSRADMASKARLYLQFGTALVWAVWPRHQRVDVWRPGGRRPSRILGSDDLLEGEDVVPCFSCPIAPLFRV
jgi:Uma2 family endonuclease